MISKKAQQEIIVTVLLVLIALAAVAAVATFVINNVKKSTAGADDKLNCAKVELEIAGYSNTSVAVNASVLRLGAGDVALKNVTISINSNVKIWSNGDLAPGSTALLGLSTTMGLKKGDQLEAAAVLSNGYACMPAASTIVA